METNIKTNTVNTVLSEESVRSFEHILHWFWNEFDEDSVTNNIMKMLEVYIKHEPENIHRFQKADWMTRFVCSVIELKDQIKDIQSDERPWEWVSTPDGWGLPEETKE